MIVRKEWKRRQYGPGSEYYHYTGWFLFGIVPIYVVRTGERIW